MNMQVKFLLITLIILISGCTADVGSLSSFLEKSKFSEYKIDYELKHSGIDKVTPITYYFKQEKFKLTYDLSYEISGQEFNAIASIIGVNNQVYICSEMTINQLDINRCEIKFNESQTSQISNPSFILQRLESNLANFKTEFSGTKEIIGQKTYCFNADSKELMIDICFTDSAIPLLIKETYSDNEVIEIKATGIEFEVNDDEFSLPAEPGAEPQYDPTALSKALGEYKESERIGSPSNLTGPPPER